MRSLSSTLLAAQQAASGKPAVKVVIGGDTFLSGGRLLSTYHREEPGRESAIIVLDNSDKSLSAESFEGKEVNISYGFATSEGKEYSPTPPLHVLRPTFNSSPGQLTLELECIGISTEMSEDRAKELFTAEAQTVKTLLSAIYGATLDPFTLCPAIVVSYDSEDDVIAVVAPGQSFRIYLNESRLTAEGRLLNLTKCVRRFDSDGKAHIFVPTTSGTTYDYEYSLAGPHTFYSRAGSTALTVPNAVKVTTPAGDEPAYSGTAQDADAIAKYGGREVWQYQEISGLQSNEQATNVAEGILSTFQMGKDGAAAIVPMNCGQELYDWVKITDSRSGQTATGNVGFIERRYKSGQYEMKIGFGGWLSHRKLVNELALGAAGGSEPSWDFINLAVKNIVAEQIDMASVTLDTLGEGETYKRVKSVHIDVNGMIIADAEIQWGEGYDPSTKWTGSNLDDLPDGPTWARVKKAALTAEGLVVLDQLVEGTHGLTLATHLSAGKLKLTSDAEKVGEWYNKSGVIIDAESGIIIKGTDMAFQTQNASGEMQCKVDSDGKIVAGAGDILLGSDGVTIKGERLKFYYGASYDGYIKATSSQGLFLAARGGKGITLSAENILLSGRIQGGTGYWLELPTRTSNPSGAPDGSMYYNTSTKKFMGKKDGVWDDFTV